MSRDLIRQLKSLKQETINPRGDWQKTNRELLLAQIKNTLPTKIVETREAKLERFWAGISIFLPRPMVNNFVRPLAVLVLISLVATGTYSATAKASYATIPGDWLYPAKRAAEKTQGAVLSLFGDKSAEAQFHVSLAQRRADEVKAIIKQDGPNKNDLATVTMADLKSELDSVNTNLDSDSEAVQADVAQDIKENTEAIKATLETVKTQLILSPSSTSDNLTQAVSETKDLAKDVSVRAVEVMVVKHLGGDTTVSKDDVTEAINTTMTNAAVDVLLSKQAIDGVSTTVGTVKTQVAGLTAEVGQKILEVKQAVSDGDLTKALDNLKQASEATKEAEKISDKSVANIQIVGTASSTPATVSSTTK